MIDQGELTSEVTDLVRHLIRNACVNDGTAASGQEIRSVDLLASYLEGSGLDIQRYEASPGRASLVTRLEGSDPSAPSLLLMGHTDVVPVNPDGWQRDPFGAELVDGFVWGRGAVDMLNLTASMAVASRRLAREGFRPRGTLVYLAVADEESGGRHGVDWMLNNARDAVLTDYVITEDGGGRLELPVPSRGGPKLPVAVAEKGPFWCTLRVRGTPGHGSMPLRTDNALLVAAEVARRLAAYWPRPRVLDVWRAFVDAMDLPEDLRRDLTDPDGIGPLIESLEDVGLARMVHAATHATIAPTMMHAGVKTNVIPDTAELTLDIRALPGQTEEELWEMVNEALGDLAGRAEILMDRAEPSVESPVQTPLWDAMQRTAQRLVPGSTNVPFIMSAFTDARFFRRLGIPSYGYGLFSERLSFNEVATMYHGNDERVDQESLWLTTELWLQLVRDFLG